jgi:UDP-N-acetylmuramate-alanine ligase
VAIISGIAWDHINVFPTFENYLGQFDTFCSLIDKDGLFIYNEEDPEVKSLGDKYAIQLRTQSYSTPKFDPTKTGTRLEYEGQFYDLQIFGSHNLQNLMGAMYLAGELNISNRTFLQAMSDFTGAGKRLQKVIETESFVMFKDFAHSPSKLKATTAAVKEQYPNRNLVACMELHTFSSLKKEFLPLYEGSMDAADESLVYFSHDVVAHKKLEPITKELVVKNFGGDVLVLTDTKDVLEELSTRNWSNSVLLMMSSGNFDGIDYDSLGGSISE